MIKSLIMSQQASNYIDHTQNNLFMKIIFNLSIFPLLDNKSGFWCYSCISGFQIFSKNWCSPVLPQKNQNFPTGKGTTKCLCFFKAIYPTNCLSGSLKLRQFVRPMDVLVCQEEKNNKCQSLLDKFDSRKACFYYGDYKTSMDK